MWRCALSNSMYPRCKRLQLLLGVLEPVAAVVMRQVPSALGQTVAERTMISTLSQFATSVRNEHLLSGQSVIDQNSVRARHKYPRINIVRPYLSWIERLPSKWTRIQSKSLLRLRLRVASGPCAAPKSLQENLSTPAAEANYERTKRWKHVGQGAG